MELEKVTAEIRPRTAWEAVDLGLSLVRVHAVALLKGWMASVYPVCLLILTLSWSSMFWGVFLIWWLKPVWERVALHPLSRSLFGEHPTWRETMRVLPRELLKNKVLVIMGVVSALIGTLLDWQNEFTMEGGYVLLWLSIIGLMFYRSGLNRSLVQPVKYLEGLEGTRSKSRIQALSHRSSGAGVGLTFVCILMEVLLFLSQVFFLYTMIPEGALNMEFFYWDSFFDNGLGLLPKWSVVVLSICYLNALSIVAWFYTGGGFGLYVNTRTWTEGWDIELKFKGLSQRLGVIILALSFFGSAPDLVANQEAQRVLDQEEFDVKTRAVYETPEKEGSEGSSSALAGAGVFQAVGTLLFWAIVGALVVGLVWVIVANSHLFGGGRAREFTEDPKKVRTVAGLNIEPENLPANLLDASRTLWEAGKYQEALGLLYRGAISSLVTSRVVEIEESDTEMDCLRRVESKGEPANASYFQLLTGAWMSQAYARRLPDDETVERLWSQWPFSERRER